MTIPRGITLGTQVSAGGYPTRTWGIDTSTGRVVGFTDGAEAMAQAVEIALNVRRFRWQIYSPRVGHEIERAGDDFDTASVRLSAAAKDCLLADDRITGVTDFHFEQDGDAMTVSFTVQTVFGELSAEVTA